MALTTRTTLTPLTPKPARHMALIPLTPNL